MYCVLQSPHLFALTRLLKCCQYCPSVPETDSTIEKGRRAADIPSDDKKIRGGLCGNVFVESEGRLVKVGILCFDCAYCYIFYSHISFPLHILFSIAQLSKNKAQSGRGRTSGLHADLTKKKKIKKKRSIALRYSPTYKIKF